MVSLLFGSVVVVVCVDVGVVVVVCDIAFPYYHGVTCAVLCCVRVC